VDEGYLVDLSVGDTIPVLVMKESSRHEGVVVSLKKGLEQQDWLRAEELLSSEDVFDAEVIDVNRGGILVEFGRLRGFVPNSHLTSVPSGMQRDRFREAKEELVGKELSLTVIEVNQRRRRLILSERAASRQRREQLLQELAEGDIRIGIVRNVVDFGAFVDLGGVDGLIHISELDWDYVEHPSKVLSVGDEVEVYVLSVDRERQRIGLSRKRVIPASTIEDTAEPEDEVEAAPEPEAEPVAEAEPAAELETEGETEPEEEV
jgi:small subunit ribosomal protein S1